MSCRKVPIRALYRRIEESGRGDLPLLSVYRDYGVVPREGRDDNFNKASDDLSRYKVVRPGDLVLNKMKTWQGSLGIAAHEGIVSPAYFVGRRIGDVEDRFMHHLLRSQPLVAEYAARSKGIRPAQWDLPWDEFAAIQVCLPLKPQQLAIADFLDAETARIDALIAKKRELSSVVERRRWAGFESMLADLNLPFVPLRRALRFVTDGPFGSAFASADYSNEGLAVVRLGNIGFAEWRGSGLARLPLTRLGEFSKYRVRAGDLLVAGLGDSNNHAGRACVAPDIGAAIVKGKCFCAQVDPTRASAEFLAMYCSSPLGAETISAGSRGSTRAMINLDIFKAWPLPLPALHDQHRIVQRVDEMWNTVRELQLRLKSQIALLQEHRQALITAAVTGKFHIPPFPKPQSAS